MIFPQAGDGVPRHPSQLYEATLEGLVLFLVVWIYSIKRDPQVQSRVSSYSVTGWLVLSWNSSASLTAILAYRPWIFPEANGFRFR